MAQVQTLYTAVRVSASIAPGTVAAGSVVTFSTNVPADLIWTLDGSRPRKGRIGTFFGESPVTVMVPQSMTIQMQANDNRPGRLSNKTAVLSFAYTVARSREALETFKTTKRYFQILKEITVDHNFYSEEGWTVPVSSIPLSYLAQNPESRTVKMRVLHNGVDLTSTTNFPTVGPNGALEVFVLPVSGGNNIVIQTN